MLNLFQSDTNNVTLYGVLESIGEHDSVEFNILAVTSAGAVAAVKFEYSPVTDVYKPYPSPSWANTEVVEYRGNRKTFTWIDAVVVCVAATVCTAVLMCTVTPIITQVIRERYQRRQLMISLAFSDAGDLLRNGVSSVLDESSV
jgi:hypothetical protein